MITKCSNRRQEIPIKASYFKKYLEICTIKLTNRCHQWLYYVTLARFPWKLRNVAKMICYAFFLCIGKTSHYNMNINVQWKYEYKMRVLHFISRTTSPISRPSFKPLAQILLTRLKCPFQRAITHEKFDKTCSKVSQVICSSYSISWPSF